MVYCIYDPEQKALSRFTTLNGLPIDQFNYNSGYQDRIGNIYFGSLKGMIAFSPEIYKGIRTIKSILYRFSVI